MMLEILKYLLEDEWVWLKACLLLAAFCPIKVKIEKKGDE